MRKNVKRLLCGLLAAALLIPAAAAAPASGQKAKLSDIQGHWAEQQIEQAVTEGLGGRLPGRKLSPRRHPSPRRSLQNFSWPPFSSRRTATLWPG
ncbi:MAG: hypothetical protein ACLUNZ_03875 [Evtepia sp.]